VASGGPAARRIPRRTRQIIHGLVSLALVVIFCKLLKGIDFGAVWAAVTSMSWLELATLGLLAIWTLATYAFVWMSVTPAVGFGHADGDGPVGDRGGQTRCRAGRRSGSASYSMLGSLGCSRSKTTVAVLVSGVWNSFIKLGLPVLAWLWCSSMAVPVGDGGHRRSALASPVWSARSWCSR
jgi:putative heme transporter